jgi:hypothetical protein
MNEYTYCPLSGRTCCERKCALWIDYKGEGGCALRALGGLLEIAETLKNGVQIAGSVRYQIK